MQVHHWWWVLALVLGVAELVTGTFYLLVLALGALAGGLAAWAGAQPPLQLLVTASVALAGWAWLWRRNPWRGRRRSPQSDPNMLLDVGERLSIDDWAEGRRTRVMYRGSWWSVELDESEPDSAAAAGTFVIGRVAGSTLVVRPVPRPTAERASAPG